MKRTLEHLEQKKKRLDSLGHFPLELTQNLHDWFRVELSYTSNAIEGNTLTRQETAWVMEKGLTVEGKTLREHLEAVNHAKAFDFIQMLVHKKKRGIDEKILLEIHRIILDKIDDRNAGRYRTVSVRVAGSRVIVPNALKVPHVMKQFMAELQRRRDPVAKMAADAHFQLVSLHPFVDGNGRTARLLMNLLLLQEGHPPASIRKEERRRYINAIEKGQLDGDRSDYYDLIYEAIDRSLDQYLEALEGKERSNPERPQELLKIGELAKRVGEATSTIRFWAQEGLLQISGFTEGGYQLYAPSMMKQAREIRRLQDEERLTLQEIKQRLTVC
jgi:Fic family protein